MKFLNDQIFVNLTNLSVPAAGTYPYTVKDSANNTLFVGNTFLNLSQTSVQFDITDIAANQRWLPTQLLTTTIPSIATKVNMSDRYTVNLSVSNVSYSGQSDAVILAYRYPYEKLYLNKTPLADTASGWRSVLMLQGLDSERLDLTPIYPLTDSDQYKVMHVFQIPNTLDGLSISVVVDGARSYSQAYTAHKPATLIQLSLSTIYNADDEESLNWSVIDDYSISFDDDKNEYYADSSHVIGNYCMDMKVGDVWTSLSTVSITDTSSNLLSYESILTEAMIDSISANGIRVGFGHGGPLCDESYVVIKPTDMTKLKAGQSIEIEADFYCDSAQQGPWYIESMTMIVSLDPALPTVMKVGSTIIADFETDCIHDFFLQWQDRFGSIQSQPFRAVNLFSESLDREEVIDYHSTRRLATVKAQPRWRVSTDWIHEHFYPYYESIYVSPFLRLYDVKEDKAYNVILTDSNYEEKTYKNQRNLFNLTLELEATNAQNIIY